MKNQFETFFEVVISPNLKTDNDLIATIEPQKIQGFFLV